jgi:hypothetical protein
MPTNMALERPRPSSLRSGGPSPLNARSLTSRNAGSYRGRRKVLDGRAVGEEGSDRGDLPGILLPEAAV